MKIKRLTTPMNFKPMFHRHSPDLDQVEPIVVIAYVHCEDDSNMVDAERALLETGEIVTQDEGTFDK